MPLLDLYTLAAIEQYYWVKKPQNKTLIHTNMRMFFMLNRELEFYVFFFFGLVTLCVSSMVFLMFTSLIISWPYGWVISLWPQSVLNYWAMVKNGKSHTIFMLFTFAYEHMRTHTHAWDDINQNLTLFSIVILHFYCCSN